MLALARWRPARGDFLRRTLVDDSQELVVATAGTLVRRQLSAANGHCADRVLFRLRTATGASCWLASLGFLLARIAVTWLHARPIPTRRGPDAVRHAVNLTSDQQILWQHGFVKLNGTIVIDLGHDDRDVVGREADHAQAHDRRRYLALARSLEIIVTAWRSRLGKWA